MTSHESSALLAADVISELSRRGELNDAMKLWLIAEFPGLVAWRTAPPPCSCTVEAELVLEAYDEARKIAVIKVVKSAFDFGLKEAKDLVESAPCVLGTVREPKAAALVLELEAAGATASFRLAEFAS